MLGRLMLESLPTRRKGRCLAVIFGQRANQGRGEVKRALRTRLNQRDGSKALHRQAMSEHLTDCSAKGFVTTIVRASPAQINRCFVAGR